MFGWLAARSTPLCRHGSRTVVSRRIQRMTPHMLMHKLPDLGSVLYLYVTPTADIADHLPPRLVVAQHAYAPLLDIRWLAAVSVVTDDGPREWCDCVDRFGRTRARLHLLPDTDYLVWDTLMTSHPSERSAPEWLGLPTFRPDSASVTNFRLREFAGLTMLERGIPTALSLLGGRVAERIASEESAVLSR